MLGAVCWTCGRSSSIYAAFMAPSKHAQLRFPGEIIHILYAGCGPFALLCLPLLPLLAGQAVHFTLLDVHARAVESVQAILAAWRLDG